MKRSFVAAGAAVLLAVFGCAVVLLYVQNVKNSVASGQQAVTVLIATKRIPAGTTGAKIRSGGFTDQVVMPRATVPADTLSSLDANLDKLVVTSEIQPSQLLLRGAFGESAASSGGVTVPEGKIALSIPMVASSTAFVHNGSKIVVFNTFTSPDGVAHTSDGNHGPKYDDAKVQVTRVVLPSVEVIAIAQTAAAAPDPTGASAAKNAAGNAAGPNDAVVVTLAVTQAEAEKLVLAAQTGLIYAALLTDTSDVKPAPGVDSKTLYA